MVTWMKSVKMRFLLEPYLTVLKYHGMKRSKDPPFYHHHDFAGSRSKQCQELHTEAIAYSGIRPLAHRVWMFGSTGDPFGKGWHEWTFRQK